MAEIIMFFFYFFFNLHIAIWSTYTEDHFCYKIKNILAAFYFTDFFLAIDIKCKI